MGSGNDWEALIAEAPKAGSARDFDWRDVALATMPVPRVQRWRLAFRLSWFICGTALLVDKGWWSFLDFADAYLSWRSHYALDEPVLNALYFAGPELPATLQKTVPAAILLAFAVMSLYVAPVLALRWFAGNLRERRIEALLLAGADPAAVAEAHFRRAFGTAKLLLVILAPLRLVCGLGPAPLFAWLYGVPELHLPYVGVTSFLEGAAGLTVDLATAWAAASLAVACAAATGSRSGGLALGVAGTAGFALGAALLAWPIREGLSALGGAAGPGVFREETWWQEPAVWDHLRFSWAFAAAYCLAAWAVSRLAVKAAGRRLRSLVAA